VAAGLVLILESVVVAPLYFGGSAMVPDGPKLRLLLANVQMENRDHISIRDLAETRNADVVVLAEVNRDWTTDLEGLEERLPHRVLEPRPDRFGMALYSRLAFETQRTITLSSRRTPAIMTRLRWGDTSVTIVGAHVPPPVSGELFTFRNEELAALAQLARNREGPFILLADLNTTLWSSHYGRALNRGNLTSAGQGFGVLPTWPSFLPAPFRIPIDHVLVSEHVRVVDIDVGPKIGSDHLPLLVEVAPQ